MRDVKVWHKLLLMAVMLAVPAVTLVVFGVAGDDRGLLAVGVAVALIAFLIVRLARRVTVPLARMADAYAAMAGGDLSVRVPVESRDEVGRLAAAFNATAAELAARREDQERQLLRAARVEAAADEYEAFAMRVARGDLEVRLDVAEGGELADLAAALNTMVESLGRLAGEVRGATGELAGATSQILTVVRQHSSATTEQAASIAQTTVTVDEVRSSAEQAATRAREVAESAGHAVDVAEDGASAVDDIVSGIALIRSRVDLIASQIRALSAQTAQIDAITQTVGDIADQSNMLALNATIEAAKAGEQGRGFAVVAAEVRNLAEQSKSATSQVRTILQEIGRATTAAVEATDEGTRATEMGVDRARRAGDAIGSLMEVVRETAVAAEAIAASAREQSVGMDEITRAMSGVSFATSEIASGADQTEQAAAGLSALAEHLGGLIERFQGGSVAAAAGAPARADRWRDPRLAEIQSQIDAAGSLEQAGEAVARAVAAAFDADCGLVARFTADGAVPVGALLPPGQSLGRMPLEGRSGLATVFRTGAPARVSDYARLGDDATARVARAGDYTNGVAVPIRVDGAVWGGVLIATRSPEPLPVRAEMFLSNAAAMLGAAIQRNASRTTAPVEVPAGV